MEWWLGNPRDLGINLWPQEGEPGSEARDKAESQAYHNEYMVMQNEEELTKEHWSQKPQRQKMGKILFCPFDLKALMLLESKTNYFMGPKIKLGHLIRVRVDRSHRGPKGRKMRREEGHAWGLELKYQLIQSLCFGPWETRNGNFWEKARWYLKLTSDISGEEGFIGPGSEPRNVRSFNLEGEGVMWRSSHFPGGKSSQTMTDTTL